MMNMLPPPYHSSLMSLDLNIEDQNHEDQLSSPNNSSNSFSSLSSSSSYPILLDQQPDQVQQPSYYFQTNHFPNDHEEVEKINSMVSSGSWDNNSTGENHEIIKSKHKLTIRWKKEEIDKNNIEAADHHHDGSSVKWMSSKMRMMRKMIVSDKTSGGSSNIASNNSNQKFEDQKQPLSPLGSSTTNNYSNQIRVCSDCNTTKTPLWRSGPRGPKRAVRAVELMHLLPQLKDPQSELLLLRSCMGIAKFFFGLRTCQPTYMEEAAILFDKELREAVEDIVVGGGPFFGDLQWRLASLPIKVGGLGLYSAVEAASYAYVASRAQSWVLQDHILRDSGVCGMDSDFDSALDGLHETIPSFDLSSFTRKDTVPHKAQHVLARVLFGKIVQDMEVKFNMTTRQKAVFGCLQAAHAQDFLLAIPIDGLGQHMSPIEYRTILKYRLMIPLFPIDEVCPVCRKACLDNFGEHAVHCRELPGFKYRHDFVRDVLFDVFRRAGISAKKEAPVNFLTDPQEGRSTLRPADVMVYGWVGGKHACVDLTGVSPLVGLRPETFTVGQAALKAASSKVAKHEKACSDNQHAFIPFAFDTFGFLAPEAVSLLQRVQKVMNSNVVSPKAMNVIFKRIGFAIQKGLAAQLVARLPFVHV